MRTRRFPYLRAALLVLSMAQPAFAERMTLSFLPPDLPPSNVCNAEPERNDPEEVQDADGDQTDGAVLDDAGRLQYLIRDIRDLTRDGADRWFDYIMTLITRRAELDPAFAGIEETFARIDVYLAAARLDELREAGLIEGLNARTTELSRNQRVRLARFYLNGIGVERDPGYAKSLITAEAYLGNASALMEVLRMLVRGEELEDWDLSPERTATLAYGGMIGRLNLGLCDRAEQMAREYLDGDILTPNPDLAYAWRKFAADMGGAEAAWRVVEHHLDAAALEKDNATLLHYLQLAVENGYDVGPEDVGQIVAAGATTETEIRKILGFNYNRVGSARRLSVARYLELEVNPTGEMISEEDDFFQYLREIAALPDPPGPVLTRLAKEILLRRGRWAGEAEAAEILQEAVARDDPEAMAMLAEILVRHREDNAKTGEAERLLTDAVARHGYGAAMPALDALYRCRLPGAPMLEEAAFWSDAYRAAEIAPVNVSAGDLASLDPAREPEAVAKLQSLALLGHAGSTAHLLQFLQSDPLSPETALRFWAGRVSGSDVALKEYVIQEFDLALTPGERQSAIGLFRRAHLDIGPRISLDLAVALVEQAGRDPEVAAEIRELLTGSGRRGEGAAIRLLQRLTGADAAEVYREFAEAIEARGDFLALMFAAPFVSDETFDSYMDRAVAVMSCTTKDVAEMADAYALRDRPDEAYRWLRIGLTMEGGHTLSKLGLSDQQMAAFERGRAAPAVAVEQRALADGDADALRRLYILAADPDAETHDPEAAAGYFAAVIQRADAPIMSWALAQYRRADRALRKKIEKRVDIRAVLTEAAGSGDRHAQFELGMLLRHQARNQEDLRASAERLRQAAEAGHGEAMVEYAFALGFGLGVPQDPRLALIWLEKAEGLQPGQARDLIGIFGAMTEE